MARRLRDVGRSGVAADSVSVSAGGAIGPRGGGYASGQDTCVPSAVLKTSDGFRPDARQVSRICLIVGICGVCCLLEIAVSFCGGLIVSHSKEVV